MPLDQDVPTIRRLTHPDFQGQGVGEREEAKIKRVKLPEEYLRQGSPENPEAEDKKLDQRPKKTNSE